MHHRSYQFRELVAGRAVDVVIGAPSETMHGLERLSHGRQIRDCARQHTASHCLIKGEVAYFADSAGLCLAAQIERVGSLFYEFGQRYLLCVPFEQLVYLCHWDEGLVRDERAVTLELARTALTESDVPVVIVPVGQLAQSLEGVEVVGNIDPSALSLRGGVARGYRYRPVLNCLLAHGMPVTAHAWFAAFAIAVALAVGYTVPWWLSRFDESAQGAAQAIAAPAPPAPLLAAASAIHSVNQLGSRIAPWALALGVRELRITGDEVLVSGKRSHTAYRRRHAATLGFEERSREGDSFRWRARLAPRSYERSQPLTVAELSVLMERLAQYTDLRVVEQRRRSTDNGVMSHVRLRVNRAIYYLLDELEALFEAVPARLLEAELHFDRRGRSTGAALLLAIPARGQLP